MNSNTPDNNTMIILTSTININPIKCWMFQRDANTRLTIYLKSIYQWLEKTNFKICLVENSGYNFECLNDVKEKYKDRFEIISFNEKEEAMHLLYNNSKGASEIFSINYAYNKLMKNPLYKDIKYFIKITARFFIPDLYEYLENKNYMAIRQNNNNRCELVGCHKDIFHDIFNPIIFSGHIESVYKERIDRIYDMDNNKVLNCRVFNIESTKRGGADESFDTI
jgi:hypothetical protein